MRVALFAALALLLSASATFGGTLLRQWQLPDGLEWYNPQKSCEVVGPGLPFFKGCYFGPPVKYPHTHNVGKRAGVAFFRICGGEQPGYPSGKREDFPFLVVDFEREVFIIDKYVDGGELIERPFSDPQYGPLDPNGFDPGRYYTMANFYNGQCWSKEDPVPLGPQLNLQDR
jgi:hypothetical protein